MFFVCCFWRQGHTGLELRILLLQPRLPECWGDKGAPPRPAGVTVSARTACFCWADDGRQAEGEGFVQKPPLPLPGAEGQRAAAVERQAQRWPSGPDRRLSGTTRSSQCPHVMVQVAWGWRSGSCTGHACGAACRGGAASCLPAGTYFSGTDLTPLERDFGRTTADASDFPSSAQGQRQNSAEPAAAQGHPRPARRNGSGLEP